MNRTGLINAINDLKLIQNADWEDMEFPYEIQSLLDRCSIVDDGLDVEKHRWYETSVVVYEISENNLPLDHPEYFGIRYVTQSYSEQSSIIDHYHTIEAFPMKEVKTITYEEE